GGRPGETGEAPAAGEGRTGGETAQAQSVKGRGIVPGDGEAAGRCPCRGCRGGGPAALYGGAVGRSARAAYHAPGVAPASTRPRSCHRDAASVRALHVSVFQGAVPEPSRLSPTRLADTPALRSARRVRMSRYRGAAGVLLRAGGHDRAPERPRE